MSDFEKLINASDLIEWIMETYADWCEGAVRGIVDHVEELPSAQPEGKWIEHNPHKWGLGIKYECSECGYEVDCEEPNFCPNCGADMRPKDVC